MVGSVFLTLLPFVPASMLVLFLVLLVQVVYRSLFVPPGMNREHDGICAACGYALGSLSDQRCPECGVDLLRSGILTRRMYIQLRGSGLGAITAWTIGVFSLGGVALTIWGSAVQVDHMMNNAFTGAGMGGSTTVVTYGPDAVWDEEQRTITGDTFTVDLEMPMDAMSTALTGPLVVVLSADSGSARLTVEEDGSWVLRDGDENRISASDALNAGTIEALFSAGGIDPFNERYRSYSDQLFVLADATRVDGTASMQGSANTRLMKVQEASGYQYNLTQQGWNSTNFGMMGGGAVGGGGFGIPYALWSPVLYGLIGLVVIYLIGVVFIVRRRRKMLSIGRYAGEQVDVG